MTHFRVNSRSENRYALQGELTFSTVSEALRITLPLFTKRQNGLRFDLDGIGRTDSAGVALLIEWIQEARKAHIDIVFARIPARLWAMLEVSGVKEVIPIELDKLAI